MKSYGEMWCSSLNSALSELTEQSGSLGDFKPVTTTYSTSDTAACSDAWCFMSRWVKFKKQHKSGTSGKIEQEKAFNVNLTQRSCRLFMGLSNSEMAVFGNLEQNITTEIYALHRSTSKKKKRSVMK